MVTLEPEEQEACGYLYYAMGRQYLAASNELTREFRGPEDVIAKLEALIEFYEAIAQNFSLALELFLKAYLRANGAEARELLGQEIRHDLSGLFQRSSALGLVTTDACERAISSLSAYYKRHQFRYAVLTAGDMEVHSPLLLRAAAQELFVASHRAVLAKAKKLQLNVEGIELPTPGAR